LGVRKGEIGFQDFDCSWKFKFTVVVLKNGSAGYAATQIDLDFYSRTKKERCYWVQTFCRILDLKEGIDLVQSGIKSQAYHKFLENEITANKTRISRKYNPK
jgi:hypothetical protein